MADADFKVRAGKPFHCSFRCVGLTAIWPDVDTLEVRAQMRQGKDTGTQLIANLHEHMTWSYDGDDLVIDWAMNGAETRALYAVDMGLHGKLGYLNVIVSDTGSDDERAVVIPSADAFVVAVAPVTTSAAGAA